jgi:hypothetical protein
MVEDRKERIDRELIELLNEIRVVLPGAQVLFASCSACRSCLASICSRGPIAMCTSPPFSARRWGRSC